MIMFTARSAEVTLNTEQLTVCPAQQSHCGSVCFACLKSCCVPQPKLLCCDRSRPERPQRRRGERWRRAGRDRASRQWPQTAGCRWRWSSSGWCGTGCWSPRSALSGWSASLPPGHCSLAARSLPPCPRIDRCRLYHTAVRRWWVAEGNCCCPVWTR